MGKERQQELKPSPFNQLEDKRMIAAVTVAFGAGLFLGMVTTLISATDVDSFWRSIKPKPQEPKRLFKVVK